MKFNNYGKAIEVNAMNNGQKAATPKQLKLIQDLIKSAVTTVEVEQWILNLLETMTITTASQVIKELYSIQPPTEKQLELIENMQKCPTIPERRNFPTYQDAHKYINEHTKEYSKWKETRPSTELWKQVQHAMLLAHGCYLPKGSFFEFTNAEAKYLLSALNNDRVDKESTKPTIEEERETVRDTWRGAKEVDRRQLWYNLIHGLYSMLGQKAEPEVLESEDGDALVELIKLCKQYVPEDVKKSPAQLIEETAELFNYNELMYLLKIANSKIN